MKAVGLDKKGEGEDITMILLREIGLAFPKKMSKDGVLQNLKALYRR